jgi:hypothetical protein
MHRAITLSLRFSAVMAAIAVISVIVAPQGPGGTPYGSALTDLMVPVALADPECEHMACTSSSTCGFPFKGLSCRLTGQDCTTIDCNP